MAANDKQKEQVQFVSLSVVDRLNTARDFLRSRETDAYRAYLSRLATPGAEARYTEDEEQALNRLRAEIEKLEREAGGQ